jgi:transposase
MNVIGNRDTVGIDLGDTISHAYVVGPDGRFRERFRLKTTPKAFLARFGDRPEARIVMETGTHSPWSSRLCSGLGHEVIVANAREVSLITQSKKKTDRRDSEILARLGRADPSLLSPIQHRSEQCHHDLAVIRARQGAVRSRTQLINTCRGLVKPTGQRLPSCAADCFHKKAALAVPPELLPALLPLLELIEKLTASINAYERLIEQLCVKHQAALHLQQIPGVGPITSLAYVLTIEDPRRFAKSREVGAYVGLVPKLDDSGKEKKQLRITKAGDVDLRTLLVTSAHYILGPWGPDSDLRRWGLSRAERGSKKGKKCAVVAVARRLAVLMHRLWITGEVYDPLFLAKQRGEADDPALAKPPRTRGRKNTSAA